MLRPITSLLSGDRTRPLVLLIIGAAVVGIGWLLPVKVNSLSQPLLAEAGRETPRLSDVGQDLIAADKPGPAALLAEAAKKTAAPGAPVLENALARIAKEQPELFARGRWDPTLDTILRADSTPRSAIEMLLPTAARQAVHAHLTHSRFGAVKTILAATEIDTARRFIPAKRAGGQPLEATLLMTALLLQGSHCSDELARELRNSAELAVKRKDLAPLEDVCFDLLIIGRRLNWGQLCEWIRYVKHTQTIRDFAWQIRAHRDDASSIYAAALLARNADDAHRYATRFNAEGRAGIRLALPEGEGAVRQLLIRQVPISRDVSIAGNFLASLALRHPLYMTAVKYLCFLLGLWFAFRALDRALVTPGISAATEALVRVRTGALTLVASGIVFILSEPFLLRADPVADTPIMHISLPALTPLAQLQAAPSSAAGIDLATIASIAFFGALQVLVYWICLLKIREIDRQNAAPLLKLKLMENEENLFDAGLYVGIGGTASALVLQVLGLIEPNLLAAYSSNLFGITCVALIKIRHVRPYKKKLILDGQHALARSGN